MSKICHEHCPGGGGGGLAVLVVVAVVLAAAVARPVVHAAEIALEIVLITAASVTGLTLTAATVYAALRVRRWRASKPRAIPAPARATVAVQGRTPPRAAIEAPKVRLADLAADREQLHR